MTTLFIVAHENFSDLLEYPTSSERDVLCAYRQTLKSFYLSLQLSQGVSANGKMRLLRGCF